MKSTTTDWCTNPIVTWLLTDGWNITESDELVQRLAKRIAQEGIPLTRLACLIRTLHPQVLGTLYLWTYTSGAGDMRHQEYLPAHRIVQTSQYADSPVAAILAGSTATIRRRLDTPGTKLDFPILNDLREQGATDYVAMPLAFSDGLINVISFAADRPGGFSELELAQLDQMLPILARMLEVHAMRRTAKTLLDTYLGEHTGERVLNGLVKRGDSEEIHAAILFCDLRDSTRLAESMSRDAFLAILNSFFDCTAGAVLDHGGEVLRFIGDATLAIFPTKARPAATGDARQNTESACRTALAAAVDAVNRMEALNRERARNFEGRLLFGIGLHIGDVTYGNIGVPRRLEFTVIGTAANEAARIESLCKSLNTSILISAAFAQCVPGELMSLGHHRLRGLGATREIFTLRGQNAPE